MPDQQGAKAAIRWYVLALVLVIADQWSKQWITGHFFYGESRPLTGFFNLVLVHNYGAAFSFLSDAGGWQRWFFTLLAALISAVIAVWLARLPAAKKLEAVALALVLGGALGNLYDRLLLGYVVDFLDFHWQGRHWPAFNLADSAICVGAGLLIWDGLFGGHESNGSSEEKH